MHERGSHVREAVIGRPGRTIPGIATPDNENAVLVECEIFGFNVLSTLDPCLDAESEDELILVAFLVADLHGITGILISGLMSCVISAAVSSSDLVLVLISTSLAVPM